MLKSKSLLKLLFVSMLAVLVLAACGKSEEKETANALEAIKKDEKIVFGVKNDTRLFGLKNPSSGEIEGFDIDIAKEIAKKIVGDEKNIEFKEVTSKTRVPMLQNGQIDAIIATMTITEERKKEVDFSDVYFEAGQSLLVKKGSDIKSIDDIKKGTKVLAVKGSTSTKNIREKSPDAEVLEYENYTEAFTALKSGQGDALTTDNAILYGMAAEDSSYEVVGEPFTDEPYGIAVKKGNEDLVKEINAVLEELKSSGKYDEIYKKWIKEDLSN
ncbi:MULTISPECIES: transporter substrate-binding domain-containing protein [Metabacillus]|uniref:Transporter substrate-binding domain-containing protein n=1 Tax=Metabacillus hrfriensis TaxID=3048891 RepID=A0ACD4RF84_9BACI|nr:MULTISPECIES: transporter substrate-binding domain-containing protein [Metabacillus]UAL53481.1 transporter substrate-binding domain-containing protein [Metabacillus dongyingensis]UOK58971.1 transporter substrate-binding domain-containing protein [Bacillus sp. OVS6]USK29806.1 transporter substrate-binding domain-containing protein [Bacillus sp. CMF21]WHZ59052.1 transporter substrate-binding domain-containing protein [Metabacillus sp. CT-WN-B3]